MKGPKRVSSHLPPFVSWVVNKSPAERAVCITWGSSSWWSEKVWPSALALSWNKECCQKSKGLACSQTRAVLHHITVGYGIAHLGSYTTRSSQGLLGNQQMRKQWASGWEHQPCPTVDWILGHLFFQWPANCLWKPTMDGLLRWPHSMKAISMDPQDFHELLQSFLGAKQTALNYLLLERQMSIEQKLQGSPVCQAFNWSKTPERCVQSPPIKLIVSICLPVPSFSIPPCSRQFNLISECLEDFSDR